MTIRLKYKTNGKELENMTNAEKIKNALSKNKGKCFCDDCLSELSGVKPRQQINAICNQNKDRDIVRIEQGDGVCYYCRSNKKIVRTSSR
jgi:Zn finger protein HypA/HybF involved in hydrogenase expression